MHNYFTIVNQSFVPLPRLFKGDYFVMSVKKDTKIEKENEHIHEICCDFSVVSSIRIESCCMQNALNGLESECKQNIAENCIELHFQVIQLHNAN